MKKEIFIAVIVLFIIGFMFDSLITFYIFKVERENFIAFESNREAVDFLIYDKFPLYTTLSNVGLFSLFVLSYFVYKRKENIYACYFYIFNIIIMIGYAVLHLDGGLSWL